MKIVWECKPAIRRLVEPHVKKWAQIVPSWCHVLHCRYSTDGADEGIILAVCAMPEYRKATLFVHPDFLEFELAEQESAIVHELLHLQLAQLQDLVCALVDKTGVAGSPLGDWATEEIRKAVEGSVEDLKLAFGA